MASREERRVGTAIPERHAEPLRVAIDDVGAHLAGRLQEREREEIRADRDEHPRVVRVRDERLQVHHRAVLVGILEHHAEHARLELHRFHGADVQIDVERFGAGPKDVDRLRQASIADEEQAPLAVARPVGPRAMQQRHRFGRGGRFVEQRRGRDLHPREVGHHRLEVQQRLEASLRDLRLVRRVGRVPPGILHDHPQDHARCDRVVIAEADVGPERLVPPRDGRQAPQVSVFAFGGRKVQRPRETDRRRNGLVHERVERRRSDRLEHAVAIVG